MNIVDIVFLGIDHYIPLDIQVVLSELVNIQCSPQDFLKE